MAIILSVAVSAQDPVQARAQLANLRGRSPKPEDATKAILDALNRYEVVAMGAAHGNKDLDDFILHLVRDSAFPSKVNDVAVECGNSLYQPILDRYIAGDDVPLSEVRQVWRNTTQPMCGTSGFYEELFPLVRRINHKVPPEKKLRMLAGDPPIDWSKVKSNSETLLHWDASIASVMQKEVLSKHRKALMLFGTLHLFHGNDSAPVGLQSAVQRYEKAYPGVTLVIADHMVFANSNDLAKVNSNEMEARMASWPVPSLIQNIEGTWLADVDKTYFSEMVDAYLYLGPSDLLLVEPGPAEIFLNKDYIKELKRRAALMGGGPWADLGNPDNISDRDSNPFLSDAFKTLFHSLGIGVGPSQFASSPAVDIPWRVPQRLEAIHLSPEVLKKFAGEYVPDSPAGVSIPPIEIAADQEGLWVDLGVGGKRRFVPLSATEFMQNDAPTARITFMQDEKGEIAGLIFRGIATTKATRLP